MDIYIDVLIFTNILINYCILCATQKFLYLKQNHFRLIISSLVSSAFSLIALFPTLNNLVTTIFKAIGCTAMCLIAFGYNNIKATIKQICCSFTISMIFCATMILFYQVVKPNNLAILNDTVYIQSNPIALIFISTLIYLIVLTLRRVLSKDITNTLVNLKIYLNDKEYSCLAKIDTACFVVEPFSGSPVIIAEKSMMNNTQVKNLRIVPYKVLGASSIMYAVKADKVIIDKEEIHKEIYIGLYDGHIDEQFKAIINFQIIR